MIKLKPKSPSMTRLQAQIFPAVPERNNKPGELHCLLPSSCSICPRRQLATKWKGPLKNSSLVVTMGETLHSCLKTHHYAFPWDLILINHLTKPEETLFPLNQSAASAQTQWGSLYCLLICHSWIWTQFSGTGHCWSITNVSNSSSSCTSGCAEL